MVEVCPYCGNMLTYEDECRQCGRQVAWAKKCYLKSESYYIQAFKAAKLRNLTKAKELLKKSICLNKYHIQSRNLLGLIYYEMGEVGLALKSWILSTSLKKENNIASDYIARVQKDPRVLEHYTDAAQLYNKALKYLNEGNEDVAAIRLKKAVGIQPNLVEARILLGLCYIKANQIRKAKEQLEEVLKIDHQNAKALTYLSEIKDKQVEEIKPYEKEYGAKKQVDKRLNLSPHKVFLGYIACFVVGILCMGLMQKQFVNPTNVQGYKKQITKLENENKNLNDAMATLKLENEEKLNDLKLENKRLQSHEALYEESANQYAANISQQAEKDKLEQSETLISQGDYEGAAAMLYTVKAEGLSEEEVTKYEELKKSSYEKAVGSLCNKGYNYLHNKNFSEAKTSLEAALLYEPNDSNKKRVLYYLGKSEYGLGNNEKASVYFNEVIQNYPGTDEAQWSQYGLNDIATNS